MIKPQAGFQEVALSTPADIAIMGGSAGCGKTFTLLMEFLRHTDTPGFGGVIFRRTSPQIVSEGGLWDTSMQLYPLVGASPIESRYTWRFPAGPKLKFSHLEYDKNVLDWQGSQIPFIGFDELTHFTKDQFLYMMSRNRSGCGVRPYIRATCNPDPDSWVADFISWWIDQETGFPIAERAGKLRYFTRDNEIEVWGDTPEEVAAKCPHIFENEKMKGRDINDLVKSVTFIPGSIYENDILLNVNPGYLGDLLSQSADVRLRLLDGNWKIRLDGMGLCDYAKVREVFTNQIQQPINPLRCITCDAARFGRDFCTIFVWRGWEVIHISVFLKSDVHDIVGHIEMLRKKFAVMKSNVVVDQDGVGGGTVKIGDYRGFRGGLPPVRDPGTRIKENYWNLKTQCYYRLCEQRVNTGDIRINCTQENTLVFDDSKIAGHLSTKVKTHKGVRDIKDLIVEDLRAIKRDKTDIEGKLHINSKDSQKNILGRSPDFGDNLMMRELLDLKSQVKKMEEA